MSAWTEDELNEIGTADELELTTLRSDGTPRKPVTIWVVRNGEHFYIRFWGGQSAGWFGSAQAQHEGHIQAGGIDKDVLFINPDRSIDDQIDAEYRTKYTPGPPSSVQPMVSPQARATTLKLEPRS